jgi:trimethylamine:corrinoid methyltransferase-like protein
MSSDRPPLEPPPPAFHVRFLTDEQLDTLQEATLRILEDVGVKFRRIGRPDSRSTART